MKRAYTEPDWRMQTELQLHARLERTLALSTALDDLDDAHINDNQEWIKEGWNELTQRYGMSAREIRALRPEAYSKHATLQEAGFNRQWW
jgi:hypothetical protein